MKFRPEYRKPSGYKFGFSLHLRKHITLNFEYKDVEYTEFKENGVGLFEDPNFQRSIWTRDFWFSNL